MAEMVLMMVLMMLMIDEMLGTQARNHMAFLTTPITPALLGYFRTAYRSAGEKGLNPSPAWPSLAPVG